MVGPGMPCRILESRVLRVKLLNGKEDSIVQDIGGWVAMPPEHWEYIVSKLEDKGETP